MKKLLKGVFYGFIGLMVIGYITGNGKESKLSSIQSVQAAETAQPVKAKKEVYQTTASKLFNAYDENEVATDENMKGKLVSVSGTVQSINKDFTDSIIVSLKTPNRFMAARMQLKDSEKGTAMKLKKGNHVVIVCERMSRVIGSPSGRSCVFN